MAELHSGTVTFLFTDIEGSTRLERQLRERYGDALKEHQTIVRAAFAARGGHEVDTQGDSFFYVFPRAKAAVDAAVDAQRALAAHAWPEGAEIRVRIGLNTGEASLEDGRYVGFAVHRAARISAAGHGGQILLSSSTRDVVEADLGSGLTIRDLGQRRLKHLPRPERVYQLVAEGLPSQFPPLKTLDLELRRKRRRMWAGVAVVLALIAAVALPVFLLGSKGGGANVPPNSVAVIDPESNKVVDAVQVGVRPAAVTVGAGSVWVANTADQTVSRIDARTRRVSRTIPVGGVPGDLAVAAGATWVALGLTLQVQRISPERNEADESITVIPPSPDVLRSPCPVTGTSLAARGETLWWACFFDLQTSAAYRIRLPTQTSVHVVEAGVSSSPAGFAFSDVAAGLGSAWITNSSANTVLQIDPVTLANRRDVPVGTTPEAVAVGFGSIWVANQGDETVSRFEVGPSLEPVTVERIPVGDGPVDVAVGENAVWVVNRGDRTVSKIDPRTDTVVATIELEHEPVRVAVGDGAVWVTIQGAEAEDG